MFSVLGPPKGEATALPPPVLMRGRRAASLPLEGTRNMRRAVACGSVLTPLHLNPPCVPAGTLLTLQVIIYEQGEMRVKIVQRRNDSRDLSYNRSEVVSETSPYI